jgi:hypothetical protein
MFEQGQQTNSLLFATVIVVVYEAVVIMMFYFLAPVVMMVLYTIFNSSVVTASQNAVYSGEFYFVTVMMFAVAMLIPLVWLILWVLRVESGYQIYR